MAESGDIEDTDQIRVYEEDKELSSTPINVVPKTKPSIFPSQKCLSDILFKRIIYSFERQRRMDNKRSDFLFKSVDFQIYTARRNILESQTLARVMSTPNVLPKPIQDSIGTSKEDIVASEFTSKRVAKYDKSEKVMIRRDEIIANAKRDPTKLTIIIFDEAHYSATSETAKGEESAYSKLLNHLNSDDYPNIVVLMISATPFNLLTVSSRFENTRVQIDPISNEVLPEEDYSGLAVFKPPSQKLHEITWNSSFEAEFQSGKEVRLKALTKNKGYQWLSIVHSVCGTKYGTSFFVYSSTNRNAAAVFKIKGSIHNYVTISTVIRGQEHFLTWVGYLNLCPGSKESKFKINLKYGMDICTIHTFETKSRTIQFGSKMLTIGSRIGETPTVTIPDCHEAPNDAAMLMFPKDDDTTFYLSLNMIVNSIRNQQPERRLVRKDTRFLDWKKDDSADFLICDYAVFILLRELLDDIAKAYALKDFNRLKCNIYKAVTRLHDFQKELGKPKYNGRPILESSFLTRYIEDQVARKSAEEEVVSSICLEFLYPDSIIQYTDSMIHTLMTGTNMKEAFGGTYDIMQQVFEKYYSSQEGKHLPSSGHMAIVRVKHQKEGDKMKQTLVCARKIAKERNLEIIQDYGEKTSLGNHINIAQADAKDHTFPLSVRIIKKIQTERACLNTNGKGRRNCDCKVYKTENEMSLVCLKCNHVHKKFNTYEDLEGLPCLLILVAKGGLGDTFPPSLMAIDNRISSNDQYLSSFAQEKGRMCRYTTLNSKLPFIYLDCKLYDILAISLEKDATYYRSFVDRNKIDDKVEIRDGKLVASQKHSDSRNVTQKPKHNNFLLHAECQCGKTGCFLSLIGTFRLHCEGETFDWDDDPEDSDEEDEEGGAEDKDKELPVILEIHAILPHWEHIKNLPGVPLTCSKSKYDRLVGRRFQYPVSIPPVIPDSFIKSKKSKSKSTQSFLKHDLTTRLFSHESANCDIQSVSVTYREFNLPSCMKEDDKIKVSFPDLEIYSNFFDKKHMNLVTIMTPSCNRAETARLNWKHLMKTSNEFLPFLHLVFVRKDEYQDYCRNWNKHVAIVQLPDYMTDVDVNVYQGGVGYCRRFIQRFAQYLEKDIFYMADDTIVYFQQGKVVDDVVMRDENGHFIMEPMTLDLLHKKLQRIGNSDAQVEEPYTIFKSHPDYQDGDKSCAAYTGPVAIIGLRKARPCHPQRNMFIKSHCSSFLLLNNKILMNNGVLFKPWKAWEDLEFCNHADEQGLNVLKMMYFEFRKVHSKDSNSMYIWSKKEVVPPNNAIDNRFRNDSKVLATLINFVKGLKLKKFDSRYKMKVTTEEVGKMITGWWWRQRSHENGTYLMLMETLHQFQYDNLYRDFAIIVPFTDEFGGKTYENIQNMLTSQIKCPNNFRIHTIISSTHPPRMIGDYLIVQILLMPPRPLIRNVDESEPPPKKIKVKREAEEEGEEGEEEEEEEEDEEDEEPELVLPKISFCKSFSDLILGEKDREFLSNTTTIEEMKHHFRQERNEAPGVVFKGPIYDAAVVNVIQTCWESGPKVSVWVEDINTSEECIMFYWKEQQRITDEVKSMKRQWLYRIENFTTKEFGTVSPMQIRLTEKSRVIPMPDDLNIKIPFNPKRITDPDNIRYGHGIDVKGKLIDVSGFETDWSKSVILKIRNEYDQYFVVNCPHSKPNDKKFAESKKMKTVMLRNCQNYQYNANKGNHQVTKKFDALRFED